MFKVVGRFQFVKQTNKCSLTTFRYHDLVTRPQKAIAYRFKKINLNNHCSLE